MSASLMLLLAAIFLPVFPLSMVFNALLEKTAHSWLRAVLLIVWPLAGIFIILISEVAIPNWFLPLVLATSALYALRILTLREVNQWSGFLATSLWSLLWLPVIHETPAGLLYSYALSMSVPLVCGILKREDSPKRVVKGHKPTSAGAGYYLRSPISVDVGQSQTDQPPMIEVAGEDLPMTSVRTKYEIMLIQQVGHSYRRSLLSDRKMGGSRMIIGDPLVFPFGLYFIEHGLKFTNNRHVPEYI